MSAAVSGEAGGRSPWTTLRSWYVKGRWIFVARLAAVGALAGLASWMLVLALHLTLGVTRPSVPALVLAVPRGALFGALLALALGAYWDQKAAQRRNKR